jgi:oligopeptide transport system substrate-binding protein
MNSPAIKIRISILLCLCGAGLIFLTGCGEILKKPQPVTFVGNNAPPAAKEFRWSNGDLPKTFDPAKATASPETDFVRALYDGLTDLDAKTLKPVPAIAAEWSPTEDFRTWTFRLRQNARWINGKPITAADFVRSWRRVVETGKQENAKLFQNVVGTSVIQSSKFKLRNSTLETNNEQQTANNEQTWFGVEAADEFVLRVWLVEPDKDFPALAAHPAFRPVFDNDAEFGNLETASKIVTSGAFRVVSADKSGVALESSKNYWNAQAVNLERVKIVPMKDADAALAAYRAGELDAVTNAKFEPLAVKLLASYRDFRRSPFNAVTFYEFNPKRAHFADRRVREALSLAVDRERLTTDELDGAGAPARALLPHSDRGDDFRFDVEPARNLFTEAGFKDGKDFPKIKLLISRNEAQRRVARAVAAQWKRNLGIETEIVTSGFEEHEQAMTAGDFDLVRRARVLPTTDETANLQLMFEAENPVHEQFHLSEETAAAETAKTDSGEQANLPKIGGIEMPQLVPNEKDTSLAFEFGKPEIERVKILNEEIAVKEFPAIPLFYPLTYALVKPYVKNFETNMLDAPQLKAVEIESNWQR